MKIEPLAYFITFRTYATWLHGDERTSVDRMRNIYGTPRIPHNEKLKQYMQQQQKQETITLSRHHGDIILNSALHVCNKNDWQLFAMHVRTNHVHLTVKSNQSHDHVTTQIKAHATRFLRERDEFPKEKKIWSRGHSTKNLWTPESLYFASEYVVERQGQRMAYHYGDLYESESCYSNLLTEYDGMYQ